MATKKKRRPALPITEYGNVDITSGVPDGFVHVDVPRVGPTCNRLGIEYGKALVGWDYGRYGGHSYPRLRGIVIRESDHPTLLKTLAEKEQRTELAIARLDVVAALFCLNRKAKRCRDLAQTYYQHGNHGFAGKMIEEKERIYRLKGQALHYLIESGPLVGSTYHKIGELWAEVLVGKVTDFTGLVRHRSELPKPSSRLRVSRRNRKRRRSRR